MTWPRLRRLAIAVGFASAGCHDYQATEFSVDHHGAPYSPDEINAHTFGFVCAYQQATGQYPDVRGLSVFWSDTQRAPVQRDGGTSIEPVGGYLTDNGAHVAITPRIESSALWHELAHVSLCRLDQCDWTHSHTELWQAMQGR